MEPRPATAREAAGVFVRAVADNDQAAIDAHLDGLAIGQLRQMAITLAQLLHVLARQSEVSPHAGPDGNCSFTADAAAHAFGTSREAILSPDRHRAVTDARAVAMVACSPRRHHPDRDRTLLDKDHTSVMYAETKISQTPRLHSVWASPRSVETSL